MINFIKCRKSFKKISNLYYLNKYSEFNNHFNSSFECIASTRKKIIILLMQIDISLNLNLKKKAEVEFYKLNSFIDKNIMDKNQRDFLKKIVFNNYASKTNNKRLMRQSNSFTFDKSKLPFMYRISFKNYL